MSESIDAAHSGPRSKNPGGGGPDETVEPNWAGESVEPGEAGAEIEQMRVHSYFRQADRPVTERPAPSRAHPFSDDEVRSFRDAWDETFGH